MNKYSRLLEEKVNNNDLINLINTNFTSLNPQIDSNIFSNNINEYFKYRKYNPDPKGLLKAREAIVNYYNNKNIFTDINRIIITSSTSESYSHIFNCIKNIKGNILLPKPSYPLFEYICEYTNTKYDYYYLNNEYKIDINSIKSNISKTKALVIISPNNPTGSLISQGEFNEIYRLCVDNKVIIIIDEVFSEYTYDEKYKLSIPSNPNTPIIFLNGISKMLALPDFKLAWINVLGKNTGKLIDRLETINDTYLNCNEFIQFILYDIFKLKDEYIIKWKKQLEINIDELEKLLKRNTNIKAIIPKGGIHCALNFYTLNWENELISIKLLEEYNIATHPGYYYDFEANSGIIIISILQNPEIFKKALSKIEAFIIKYSK